VVNDTSDYILKYDRNGNFKGGLKVDIDGAFGSGMAIDHLTGQIYISGNRYDDPLPVGNMTIKNSMYVCSFDKNGKFLWARENIHRGPGAGFWGRPVIDNAGYIYIGGESKPPDTFNGYTFVHTSTSHTPFIVKMDRNGNNVWARNADVDAATGGKGGVALRNSGEVVLLGQYPGKMIWAQEYPAPPTSGGYDIFLARFNTQTGRCLGVETINPTSGNESPRRIVSDGRNNVYIGSEFRGSVTVNGTQLNNSGGETDWFVVKFGHDNCNCTNIPEPKFSFIKNGLDVNFSYTGGLYSTIEWDFCDGNKSTQSNPTHTYAAKGIYTVCVKVTNNCGDNTYCDVVDFWPTDINEQVSIGNIKIYPNPASDILYVDGLEADATIELFDIVGRKVKAMQTVNNRESIDISMLQPGNYIIRITNAEGRIMTGKVLKR
ncbi:MAG: T9SS type A sorting domain-containing protein, partial [Candidatus Kuenenia stuttgartiensis]|nr:T9SS type A sorting domain-containing protein [Candidatus Kuenenia stuttgartiensis]